jgi:hypothetical protein
MTLIDRTPRRRGDHFSVSRLTVTEHTVDDPAKNRRTQPRVSYPKAVIV